MRHFGPRSLATLDAPPLPRPDAVVRLRRHVLHAENLEARGLARADRRLAPGAGPLHEHLNLLQAVLHPLARARVGRHLRGERRRLARALASPRVGLRALPVRRQPAPVAQPAVGADLGEPLQRLRALAPQVALDLQRVDVGAELRDLVVGEVANLRVGRELELGRDLARRRLADAVDVRQPDLEPLLVREVDPGDARHLALPLLVTGIAADDHGRAVPLDHAAALAHGLDGWTNFHGLLAMPVGDPTAVQVVRAELHLDLVPRQDADVVLAHLPGDGREDGVAGLELHPEHRARERLDDLALNLDLLFLGRHFLSVQRGF